MRCKTAIIQYVDNIDAVERYEVTFWDFEIDHIVIYKDKVAIRERVTLWEKKNGSYLIYIFNSEAEMCFHVI